MNQATDEYFRSYPLFALKRERETFESQRTKILAQIAEKSVDLHSLQKDINDLKDYVVRCDEILGSLGEAIGFVEDRA